MSQNEPEQLCDELEKRLCEEDLLFFIQKSHHDYKSNWFHEALCRDLEIFYDDVINGRNPHLMVFAPPRSGKTEIVSRHFPAWAFGKNPNIDIIGTSYAASLAEANCRDVQRIMDSDVYLKIFPKSSMNAKNVRTVSGSALRNSETFEIVGHRGIYRAAGVGGGITGKGFSIGCCDDPFKDHEEAYSKTIRDKVYDWYKTTFYTRKSPRSGVIIINTRWHEDDLCGRLLADDPKKWKVVSYKAIAEEDETHRKKGEALHPERYPIETLLEFKKTLGSRFFAAMYQQSPVPAEGSIINRTWFKYYKVLPLYDEMILSWDMAFKDSDNSDFVVGQCWARAGSLYYLVDQVRARMGFSATVEALKMMCKKYPKANAKLVEDKANGSAIIDHLKKEITGLIPIVPKESKLARLASVSPMFEAGNVFLPEAEEWCHDYTVELTTFPSGAHDDQVDSTSMALCYLRNNTNKFFGIMKR
jgi:predicted phage terminase large subunit-like protein